MRASILVGGAAVVAALSVLGGWNAPAYGADTPPPLSLTDVTTDIASPQVDAQDGEPPATALTVLLMGDSYTAGNGARTAAGEASYYGPERCMRSTSAWGEQYAHLLESEGYAVTLLNRACSAATTEAILGDRFMKDTRVLTYPERESAGAPMPDSVYTEWARQQPRCTPAPATSEYMLTKVTRSARSDGTAQVTIACERWLRPQVDALNPDVDLVLLTAGGNDVHFPDIVRACLILGEAGQCESALDEADAYVRESFADDLVAVFDAIAARTDSHAKVAYLAYPRLEVSDDLTLTGMGVHGLSGFPVAQRLDALAAAGMEAQRQAVAAANERHGAGMVTFVDGVPALFDGHEPDARPSAANPDRWMYEVFETTTRDEWYHLNATGQRELAAYVASFGTFGAADDNGAARDIAIVVGDQGMSRIAVAEALRERPLWDGAQVTVVEQRLADDGVNLERRIVAARVSPEQAERALADAARPAWQPAVSVTLPARWNAAAQTIFVGDASLSLLDTAPVWTGEHEGRPVAVETWAVDVEPLRIGGADAASRRIAATAEHIEARLGQVLADASAAPFAWAGGPYVATGTQTTLTAQGSFGRGQLRFAWDLDGDGVFETTATGPELRVKAGHLKPGWVSVRVVNAGGYASVAWAWVASASAAATQTAACDAADGTSGARGGDGRQGCGSDPIAASGPEAQPLTGQARLTLSTSGDAVAGDDARRLLAALTMLPLMVEERVASAERARVMMRTTARARARRRPRELVLRERGLAALRTPECLV